MRFLLLLAAIVFPLAASAAPEAKLYFDVSKAAPTKPFHAVLELVPDEGWHSYWLNPGDSGVATSIDWQLPEGWQASPIIWPAPELINIEGLVSYGYSGKSYYIVELTPPAGFSGTASIKAKARWLLCKEICVPGEADLEKSVESASAPVADDDGAKIFAAANAMVPEEITGASFNLSGDKLAVSVPWHDGDAVEFYPETDNVIINGGKVESNISGGNLHITMPTVKDAKADSLVGVIKSGKKSYRIIAAKDAALAAGKPSANADGSIALAILFAWLGGIILNAMPCVFPILSLKAISITKSSGKSGSHALGDVTAYTGGVVSSFAVLALLLIALKSAGSSVGWGFQMQAPVFVAAMSVVMFLIGLSLSGVFHLPSVFGNLLSSGSHKILSSFVTGALATAVATPCTAPFMAGAIGFALTQPPLAALAIFIALGVGLATPYALIVLIPAVRNNLPKPGKWMEIFKQLMAFPMYASSAWLAWVLSQQSGSSGLAALLTAIVVAAVLAWSWELVTSWNIFWRYLLRLILAAFVVMAVSAPVMVSDNAVIKDGGAIKFSTSKLAELRDSGRIVLVNVTADWCITCKVNEKVAFSSARVQDEIKQRDIAYMMGDWTSQNSEISAYLASFGRSGVPMYVLYVPGHEPKLLPQLLTPGLVVEAIESSLSK